MLFEKIWIYFVFFICFGFLGVTIGLVNVFEENPMLLIFTLSWVLILCFLTRLCNIFDHFRPDFLVISVLLSLTFIVLVVDHRDLDGKGGDSLLSPAVPSHSYPKITDIETVEKGVENIKMVDHKHRLIHFHVDEASPASSIHIHYDEVSNTVNSLFSPKQAFSTSTGTYFLCLFFLFVIFSFSFLLCSTTCCFWKPSFIKLPFNSNGITNRIFDASYDWSYFTTNKNNNSSSTNGKEKTYKRDVLIYERNCKALINFFNQINIIESNSSEITSESDDYEPITNTLEPFRSVTKTDIISQISIDHYFNSNGFVCIECLLPNNVALSYQISSLQESQTNPTPRNIKRSLKLYNVNFSVLGTNIVNFYAQKSVTDHNWVFKHIPREILRDLPEYKQISSHSDIMPMFFTSSGKHGKTIENNLDGISSKVPSKVTQRIIDISVHDAHHVPPNADIFTSTRTAERIKSQGSPKMDENMLTFVKFSLSNLHLWDTLNPHVFLKKLNGYSHSDQNLDSLSNLMVIIHVLSKTYGGSSKLSKTSNVLLNAINNKRLRSVLEAKIAENNNNDDTTPLLCGESKYNYNRISNWIFFGLFLIFLVGFCCLSPEKTVPWDLAHPMNWISLLIRLICIFTLWVVYILFFYFRELNRTSTLICIYYKCKLLLLKLTKMDLCNTILAKTNVKIQTMSRNNTSTSSSSSSTNNGDCLEHDKISFLQIPKDILSGFSEMKMSSVARGQQVTTNKSAQLADIPLHQNRQVVWGKRKIYFNGLSEVVPSVTPVTTNNTNNNQENKINNSKVSDKIGIIQIPNVFQMDMFVRVCEPFIHDMEESLNRSFVKSLNSVYSGYFDYFSHVKSSEFITELPFFLILIFIPSLTLVIITYMLQIIILCSLVFLELRVWYSFKDVPKVLDKYLLRTNFSTMGVEENQNDNIQEDEDKEIATLVNMLGLIPKVKEKKSSNVQQNPNRSTPSNNNNNNKGSHKTNHVSLNMSNEISQTVGVGITNSKQKSHTYSKKKRTKSSVSQPQSVVKSSVVRKQKRPRKSSNVFSSKLQPRHVIEEDEDEENSDSDDNDDNNNNDLIAEPELNIVVEETSDTLEESNQMFGLSPGVNGHNNGENQQKDEKSQTAFHPIQNIFEHE